MKRTLLAALLLVGLIGGASAVQAATGYDVIWNLADEFGMPSEFDMNTPGSGVHFLVYNGVTHRPEIRALGDGLFVDGTNITPTGLPFDAVDGLDEAFAAVDSGKANVSHTHVTSDIIGLSGFVDGRIASSTFLQADWNQAAATSSNYIKNKPSLTYATTTRSLNSAFQISSTSAALVSYTVDVATTLSLTGGAAGTVTLQYADDSAFTTNVKTVQSSVNGNTGALTIGLTLTQTATASVTGVIPAGKYVKLVTANTAGTPTFTYRTQQEVLLPL